MQKDFKVKGMHCTSCERLIKDAVTSIKGVKKFSINYESEKASVTFDPSKTSVEKIYSEVKELGYNVKEAKGSKDPHDKWTIKLSVDSLKSFSLIAGLAVIVIGGYLIMQGTTSFSLPTGTTSLVLLFITGLMVGFHCIGMCGGFVMSYASKEGSGKSHLMYGSGKLISYSVIGGLFGLIGSIFMFTPMIRGFAGAFAGMFLVIYGLNMLNIFPALRKIRIPVPQFLNKFVAKKTSKSKSPLTIGLLNGLMIACGPLQAMYIYAAGTGSFIQGALSLFFFGLGTLPVMLGFGFFTSYISKKTTHNIIRASGAIMMVMGLLMLNYGLTLTGTGLDLNTIVTTLSMPSITGAAAGIEGVAVLKQDYQEIRMEVNNYGWSPDKFVLKTGVPVKWVINGKQINGCNNAIQVPRLGLEFDVQKGEQVIEFTPANEGVITWSCWMGMIPGIFIVKDDIDLANSESVTEVLNQASIPTGGSCGGSCGGSTCGAATGGSCGCGG